MAARLSGATARQRPDDLSWRNNNRSSTGAACSLVHAAGQEHTPIHPASVMSVTKGAATSARATSRKALEEAHAEAARTASRTSALGALGFGLALAMGAILGSQAGFLRAGYGLEMILFAGGLGGGLVFTVLAARAARVARACRQHLDEGTRSRKRS